VIQATFTVMFYFVTIPIYNGFLMLGYSTIYTSLPVFSLVFDEDADVIAILSYPPLYKTLQKGRNMNLKTFMVWLFKSIFQGTTILMLGLFMFRDSFANIVMITFTSLIMTEMLNVYTQIHRLTFPMALMQVASAVVYFISIILMREYFDLYYFDSTFLLKVGFITLVSWLPF
jgi:phospholipid-translocating ATPase